MKTTELVKINPSEFGLQENQAIEIQKGLDVVISERELLIKEFQEVSKLEVVHDNIPKFKELRLRIMRNRTQGIDAWYRGSKEYFLRGGQFCDAIKRRETQINEAMEAKLMDGEKFFENQEKERITKLNEDRMNLISPYVDNAELLNLGTMQDEVFNAFFESKKKEHLDKIEAEKKAEEERIAKERAEKERQIAIEKENARLKAEAEAKEKQLEKERLEREAVEKKRLETERLEWEKQQAILDAERKEKERIEAELKAKQEEAERLERERVEAIEKELSKGDSEKVIDLVNDLKELKTKYEFKSKGCKKMYEDVNALIDKVIAHIQ